MVGLGENEWGLKRLEGTGRGSRWGEAGRKVGRGGALTAHYVLTTHRVVPCRRRKSLQLRQTPAGPLCCGCADTMRRAADATTYHHLPPATYHLPPITYRLPPTYHLPPTVHHPLPSAQCPVPSAPYPQHMTLARTSLPAGHRLASLRWATMVAAHCSRDAITAIT